MSNRKEKQVGLPDIYLSPTYHREQSQVSSDTENAAWEDTDNESWNVVPEIRSSSPPQTTSSLSVREEIEGVSPRDAPSPETLQESSRTDLNSLESQSIPDFPPHLLERESLLETTRNQIPRQRGETPGSDSPSMAGITAFVRRFRQPLNLDTTQTQMTRSSELIFSPGGDQGFIVPGGIHAYYNSISDTDTLEWGDNGRLALVPIRDAVEGADALVTVSQTMASSVEDMERNSPAGLSTPDAEIDLPVTSGSTMVSKKPQKSVRPPAVGQSEEVLVQSSRKVLGSIDGEESEEESNKRTPNETATATSNTMEVQLGSLGSQSENTDSMSTVMDMRRGEVQGCENVHVSGNVNVSSAVAGEPSLTQPTFIVGGLISPRGKLRQFQEVVKGRMQDVKASLKLGTSTIDESLDRQHYLNQLPLCPGPVFSTNEPEISLSSLVSMESTNPPESSERVTSPSVLSVSSVASSKRMEWDSGADVGYLGTNSNVTPAASLSTLERIALGSYASVLRTEPEGTTQAKEKQKGLKKIGKFGTNKGNCKTNTSSKQFATDKLASSSLQSVRNPQNRIDKASFTSSEENLSRKQASPNQSPRRRLRRRALVTSSQDGETSLRKSNRPMHSIHRLLQETTQGRHKEGKSSSLSELATSGVSIGQCQRSNSQQCLPLVSSSTSQVKSSNVAADMPERDSSRTITNASWNINVEKQITNTITSTSTSTLVQSMSPLPVSCTIATTTVTAPTPVVYQQQQQQQQHYMEKDSSKPVTFDSRCSSMSSLGTSEKQHLHNRYGRPSWTPSSENNMSSRSETSSPAWLPSNTDTESLTSRPISTDELGDLKARKNSENVRSYECMVRRGSSSDLESREVRGECSSSSPGHLAEPSDHGGPDNESTLENHVSLQSFNNALHALSVKLQEHIQALLDKGSLKKEQDYNKLQDYVTFVGIPSVTEEECRLRQGVASVITRMFGEIVYDHPQLTTTTDTSNTFTSETSDSHPGDHGFQTPVTCEDLDVPCFESGTNKGNEPYEERSRGRETKQHSSRQQEEHTLDKQEKGSSAIDLDRCTTPGGTVVVVPYRPPSASRTYFMAVSNEWEGGMVEGEQIPATTDEAFPRGQAEGELEEVIPADGPVTSPLHTLSENSCSSNDWDSEKAAVDVDGSMAVREEEDHKTLPSEVSSEQQHYHLSRRSEDGGDTPQSESSPSHNTNNSSLLHTWPKDELSSSHWWGGGRCEGLYQDRRGGLHVANHPPGYTDDHDDSHPSESLSDHDHHHQHHQHHHRRHSGEGDRMNAHPWTSSGSESAYETIRERHRHVDEALASSFEFYSTSPRDARLLGYVSSEGQEEDDRQRTESPISPPLSPTRSDSASHSKPLNHPPQQQQQQQTESQNSTASTNTGTNDVSSQISFIQLQKQKYVRKIQRHIHTLEKLEKALLDQLGDSITSEGTLNKKMIESISSTASGTHGNACNYQHLDHSDTTTSSIMSSEGSARVTKKQKHLINPPRIVSRNSQQSGQQGTQAQASDGKGEETGLSQGTSVAGNSYTFSPRLNVSRLSSDVNSSRASTMGQVEEEVRKLASTEKKTRRIVLQPHRSSSHSHSGSKQNKTNVQKTEPYYSETGEEEHVGSIFTSHSVHSSSSPDVSLSGHRRLHSTAESFGSKRIITGGGSSSELHSLQVLTISEESTNDLPASEGQLCSHGDGRESRDRNHVGKVAGAASVTSVSAMESPAAVSIPSSVPTNNNNNLCRDFGQMFPSSECIVEGGEGVLESVGVQTGNSLLRHRKSSKKTGEKTSVSTSDKESTMESLKKKNVWNNNNDVKHSSESEGNNYTAKHRGKTINGKTTSEKTGINLNRKPQADIVEFSDNEKETTNESKRNKETRSKTHKHLNNNNNNKEKLSARSRKYSPKIIKTQHTKEHKSATKSRKEDRGRLRNRSGSLRSKPKPKSDSEDKSSVHLSLSKSLESMSLESSEHSSSTLQSKTKPIKIKEKCLYANDEGGLSTGRSKDQYSQQDEPSSIVSEENSCHSHLTKSEYSNCLTSLDEPLKGLKGGAEESLLVTKPPECFIISPPLHQDRYKKAEKSPPPNFVKSASMKSVATHKQLTQNKRHEKIMNKTNLKQHSINKKETDTQIIIQGSDTVSLTTLHTKLSTHKETVPTSEHKKPVRFDVTCSDQKKAITESVLTASTFTAATTTTTTTTKKVMTLQEALATARPDYLREAGDRSAMIQLKREMRQAAQTHNHKVLSQLPLNLQTPSTLQRFLYKPDVGPLFSYKDIRQQNQRLYKLLPEARQQGTKKHVSAVRHTNRLLANLYSQRLRKKVIQGRVSHAHKEVVTPIVHRIKQH